MPPKPKKPPTTSTTNSSSSKGPRVLYWHRTDLRLHDSPALRHALSISPSHLIPLWTWDPHYVYRMRGAANRWNFLLECMTDLSLSLSKLNPRQKLFVVRTAPSAKFWKLLLKEWKVDVVVFEADTDAYARMRDGVVRKVCGEVGVKCVSVSGRTLFDCEEVVRRNGGKATMSMAQLLKAVGGINGGKPNRPAETPTSLPDPLTEGEMDLSELEEVLKMEERREQAQPGWPRVEGLDYNAVQRTLEPKGEETQYSSGIMGPNRDFAIPVLSELGISPDSVTTPHHGGESLGLALLATHITNEEFITTFEKPATSPAAFAPQSTTLLSPHMHFGSVSCRKFYWDVQDLVDKRRREKKNVSQPPVNIAGQLLFRDMYFAAHAAVGMSFGQVHGNPVCRFIPWHLPSRYLPRSSPDAPITTDGTYIIDSPLAEAHFQRWKHGLTGFPWIDALMRQLRTEGWIHHLGRHAVACFLTRGGCFISWERGAEVFEEWLVDHEVACNAGNWMWLSCSAFFAQFFRMYSPVAFGKKWDPKGAFVRRYVPELERFGDKYIYEPWRAPVGDQKKWGCLIKGDGVGKEDVDMDVAQKGMKVYPKPMFDFDERRTFCLEKMKEAYKVGLFGDDERVLSGEWRGLFGLVDGGEDENANGVVKEEANGYIASGGKRSRKEMGEDDGGEEVDDDEGENEGEGEDDEPPTKAAKTKSEHKKGRMEKATKTEKTVKMEKTSKQRQQGTLDAMVTRSKKAK